MLGLLKLRLLKIFPEKTRLLVEAWALIEKYHIYEADVLQILSAKQAGAEKLYTADELIHEVELRDGLDSEYIG